MKRLTTYIEGIQGISCESCLGMQHDCNCEDCLRETVKRLSSIEDILGDDYDLDKLKDIVEADREGRLEIKVKARRCPKCGKFQLYPRIDWRYYYCFNCKTQFTKQEAEEALRRMQDEGVH